MKNAFKILKKKVCLHGRMQLLPTAEIHIECNPQDTEVH